MLVWVTVTSRVNNRLPAGGIESRVCIFSKKSIVSLTYGIFWPMNLKNNQYNVKFVLHGALHDNTMFFPVHLLTGC